MPISHPDESGLLASYVGLLFLATSIIYVGAWSSLPKPPKPPVTSTSPFEDDDEDEDDIIERVSSADAYLFPLIGSAVLGGLYLIFKYFGKEWINWILGIYFSIAGVGSVWKSSIALYRFCVGENVWKSYDNAKLLVLKRRREIVSISLRTPSLFLTLPSIIPSILYSSSLIEPRPAILSNILAISFAHSALSVLKLDGFATGCILLTGLFAYDIWWVFGTRVMVSVATGLDVPIKLLWPKSVVFSSESGFTMLGLGDVIIPGAFITLALRYDLSLSVKKDPNVSFRKTYFNTVLASYVAGLSATMAVMHNFKAAQPALLYLSPACILSFLVTAYGRGEVKRAFEWRDEPPTPATPIEYPVHEPLEQTEKQVGTSELAHLSNSRTGEDFVNVEVDDEVVKGGNPAPKRKQQQQKKH